MDPQRLLDRLQENGVLSPLQLEYLQARGFVFDPSSRADEGDEDGYNDYENYRDYMDLYMAEAGEEVEKSLSQPRRRKGRSSRKTTVKAAGLAARVTAALPPPGEPHLFDGLFQICALLPSKVERWQEAATRVGQSNDQVLIEALEQGFSNQTLSPRGLWTFLELDTYRTFLRDNSLQGPAVNAYQALLSAADLRLLPGKYTWLLRYDAFAWVFQLIQAQHRLLHALGQLFRQQPLLVAAALRRQPQRRALLSLILLYNAGRYQANSGGGFPYPSEEWVARQEPVTVRVSDTDWETAWSGALLMDPQRLLPFFVTLFGPVNSVPPLGAGPVVELWCPDGWNSLLYGC